MTEGAAHAGGHTSHGHAAGTAHLAHYAHQLHLVAEGVEFVGHKLHHWSSANDGSHVFSWGDSWTCFTGMAFDRVSQHLRHGQDLEVDRPGEHPARHLLATEERWRRREAEGHRDPVG